MGTRVSREDNTLAFVRIDSLDKSVCTHNREKRKTKKQGREIAFIAVLALDRRWRKF
jgi:hypothetical protein